MQTVPAKTIVTKTKTAFWFGANYNMNLYRGCNHGCIYCDSRSECYRIEDFDTIRIKENAIATVEQDLRRKKKKGVIATGAMSDPYNPYEKTYEYTKKALELVRDYGFGIAIATKSGLITRDAELLSQIQQHAPVIAKLSITTADDDLARKIEPNAPLPSERFRAIHELTNKGVYSGVLMMPILPFLEDTEENIQSIITNARDAGARFIFPSFGVTLRQNQRVHFYRELDRLFPGVKEQYADAYGFSYECTSPNANRLWKLFTSECKKYRIPYRMPDIIDGYRKRHTVIQTNLLDL